jgi:hypothetical protein
MEEKMFGPPSYVGWLTCLEINANARSPEANASADRRAFVRHATELRTRCSEYAVNDWIRLASEALDYFLPSSGLLANESLHLSDHLRFRERLHAGLNFERFGNGCGFKRVGIRTRTGLHSITAPAWLRA